MGYRMSGRFEHRGKVYRFRSWLTDSEDGLPEVQMAVKELGVRRSLRFLESEPASEETQIEWFKEHTLDNRYGKVEDLYTDIGGSD